MLGIREEKTEEEEKERRKREREQKKKEAAAKKKAEERKSKEEAAKKKADENARKDAENAADLEREVCSSKRRKNTVSCLASKKCKTSLESCHFRINHSCDIFSGSICHHQGEKD